MTPKKKSTKKHHQYTAAQLWTVASCSFHRGKCFSFLKGQPPALLTASTFIMEVNEVNSNLPKYTQWTLRTLKAFLFQFWKPLQHTPQGDCTPCRLARPVLCRTASDHPGFLKNERQQGTCSVKGSGPPGRCLYSGQSQGREGTWGWMGRKQVGKGLGEAKTASLLISSHLLQWRTYP